MWRHRRQIYTFLAIFTQKSLSFKAASKMKKINKKCMDICCRGTPVPNLRPSGLKMKAWRPPGQKARKRRRNGDRPVCFSPPHRGGKHVAGRLISVHHSVMVTLFESETPAVNIIQQQNAPRGKNSFSCLALWLWGVWRCLRPPSCALRLLNKQQPPRRYTLKRCSPK